MSFSIIAGAFWAAVSVLSVCAVLHKTRRPLWRALFSAGGGVAALGAVNLLALYTGVSIVLNYATAFVAVVLGVPGIVSLLVLRLVLLF